MNDFTFEGFEPANTTPVPDVLFDELLTVLSGTQLKVLLYVIRRTLGFKKSSDGISLSQFTNGITTRDGKVLDKGCGINKRSTVSKILRELIEMGCLESEKSKTDLGDDAVTIYRVHFKGVVAKTALPSPETPTTVVPNQALPGSPQMSTRGSANLATHKKQLTRNSNVQETERQEEGTLPREDHADTGAIAPTPAHSQDEPVVPGHDPRMPHLAVNCKHWRLMRGGLNKATCQDYQEAIDLSAGMLEFFGESTPQQDSYSHPNGQATQGDTHGTRHPDSTLPADSRSGGLRDTARANPGATAGQATARDAQQAAQTAEVAESAGYEKAAAKRESAETSTVAMPPADAPWPCPETAVRIVEAKLGKAYRANARDKQLVFAKRMFREDPDLTRAQFETAYDERDDDWWHKHKGLLHVQHMVEKDRVHEMLDRIEGRARATPAKKPDAGKGGFVLAVNDPTYNIDDDFYNNREAWAKFGVTFDAEGAAHV